MTNEGVIPKEIYYLTDGAGRHYAVADSNGSIHPDVWNETASQYLGARATGAVTQSHSFGEERLSTPRTPGLSYFRNRVYDQETGRWTQEDPIGLAGGINLYQFNGNDPATYGDPFGLKKCPPDCGPVHAFAALAFGSVGVIAGAAVTSPSGPGAVVGATAGGTIGAAAGVATVNLTEDLVDAGVHAMGRVSQWIGHIGMAVVGVFNPADVQQGDHTDTGTGQMTQPVPKTGKERKDEDEGGQSSE